MRRFIITVLVATVLHAVACIIAPPFEFGHNRTECFFFALGGGLMAFPIMFAVVLLPLRAGLRRFMPHRTQRTHAIAAALVFWSLATAWVVAHVLSGIPSLPFQHGYLCHWIFWSIFSFAVAISFFWPFGASNRNVSYDRTAMRCSEPGHRATVAIVASRGPGR